MRNDLAISNQKVHHVCRFDSRVYLNKGHLLHATTETPSGKVGEYEEVGQGPLLPNIGE